MSGLIARNSASNERWRCRWQSIEVPAAVWGLGKPRRQFSAPFGIAPLLCKPLSLDLCAGGIGHDGENLMRTAR
jgi:hypothetical protein